ncbi:hypothetical protein F5B17DRAFT_429035 [Nemania serpens]|nr:hypothetical protein F5B17DRAFT_429035 [Nemania serpens]
MLALILLLISMLQHVVGLPSTGTNLTSEVTSPIHALRNPVIESRAIPIRGDLWQYNREECLWVRQFYPVVATSCTEYCVAGLKGDNARLKYHIMMTGNGQDLDAWCENFKRRVMFKCNVGEPDVFDCNEGRAPLDNGLETYAYDTWEGKVVTMQGINLRFDFTKTWYRDANHRCVAETISDVTCRGVDQRMGLRCLPVNWRAPPDQDDDDTTPIPPQDCLRDDQVPPSSV